MDNDSSKQTFIALMALDVNRRVKLTATGEVTYADAIESAIGITLAKGSAGKALGVRLLNDTGTFAIEANEAIAAYSTIYAGDAGKISGTDVGSAVVVGVNKDAAAGDGDVIECILA